MVACRACGTENRLGGLFCSSCMRELDVPRVTVVAPPPPPPPGSLAPAFAGVPAAVPSIAAVQPTVAPRPKIVWRWPHLLLVGVFAWGAPTLLAFTLGSSTFAEGVQRSLLFQILGYLAAAGIVFVLVQRRHAGDWSSIGISFTAVSYEEVLKGAAFGAALFAVWMPVGLLIGGGDMDFDPMIQALVGGTSSFGLLLAAIVVIAGAPLIEEIYYRGMLYEKLRRRGLGGAIIVTSLLFVLAHGALIIPPLLLLAFGLGWMRRTHGLWFTIAGHAAWNLIVMVLASSVLLSAARPFTPDGGLYEFRYDSSWQRLEEMELSAPGINVDLVLQGPNASAIFVARVAHNAHPGATPKRTLTTVLNTLQTATNPLVQVTPSAPVPFDRYFPGAGWAYEVTNQITAPEGTGTSRQVALLPNGSSEILVLQLACPSQSCSEAAVDFDALIDSLVINAI